MLETLSNYFYDPLVFWGLPLALALLKEAAGAVWPRDRSPRGTRRP
ncbi:MAG: hypothetical protein O7E56_07480 [SAR324 cluster bacterium]|nr:hypothetical protein [SAR324 cluster bacterium]MCZ6628055.1 hypothetical protein [SAR324 cluster bacterium]MCZ6646256.1 hypothetical protein [SAR324 cluster bacterium]MCZ6842080.1 hypothetical protein [SAR324 cluster bacterium]